MGSTETYNVQQHCMINMLFQEFLVKSDSASDIQTTQAQKLWHNERTDQDSNRKLHTQPEKISGIQDQEKNDG